jgi:hypothetical protein
METAIATTTVLVQRANETPLEVTIGIGQPRQVGHDPEEWACPVSLRPLYNHLHDAHGNDAFQALCLAASLVLDLLHGVVEKGGSVSFVTGERFPLETYSFGAAAGQRRMAP